MQEKEIKRNEIYYADIRPSTGYEIRGSRPVVILQNDIGNTHAQTVIVAPITSSRTRKIMPTHLFVQNDGLRRNSRIMLEQIKTLDKSRLLAYIGTLDEKYIPLLNKAICISLAIEKEETT